QLFNNLTRILGTHHIRTSSYNPRTNGMIERFHRQLNASLKCVATDHTWSEALPIVLLGIRSTFKEDLNSTAAEMLYGQQLRLPADIVEQPQDISLQRLKAAKVDKHVQFQLPRSRGRPRKDTSP